MMDFAAAALIARTADARHHAAARLDGPVGPDRPSIVRRVLARLSVPTVGPRSRTEVAGRPACTSA